MAGYSGTPLIKKLGIKPHTKLYFFQPPENYFDWLNPMPEEIDVKSSLSADLDFIHVFVTDRKTFENKFSQAKKKLTKDGSLWISWPKKSAKVATDLDENIIREFGLKEGLVDVKVCAVSEIWSGLKFVYRTKDRS